MFHVTRSDCLKSCQKTLTSLRGFFLTKDINSRSVVASSRGILASDGVRDCSFYFRTMSVPSSGIKQ